MTADHADTRRPEEPARTDHRSGGDDLAETFARLSESGLAERMGLEMLRMERGDVRARIPVEGNTQPMGLLHGGASAALAETVASVAAVLAAPEGHAPVGVDLNATHHRAARTGHVTARASAVHEGRRSATYGIEVRDDDDLLVCTARLTCMFIPYPR
ncbi:PaaI family thioesterase [Georgenia sp. Z1491]|uniref:PaaI family thioesterase n=1 Tax=Georgenia sp. Z1491 TaxID=3416707 RepID=UPI003CEF5A15